MLRPGRESLVKGFSDMSITDYSHNMVDTAVRFGASKARAEKELREVLDFEVKLATVSMN